MGEGEREQTGKCRCPTPVKIINKLTSVFHASVLLLIMNFVKVAVDPRGDSRVDPQTTLTML